LHLRRMGFSFFYFMTILPNISKRPLQHINHRQL
jgi:hypothetical protein